ncbi:MAG: hypothetical protein ACXAD7_19280 [Candidatus Kariarchaeaceae archaeon]|jgi:VIT1/CCC1 family predicted Fe2+/Mn2+ transporter
MSSESKSLKSCWNCSQIIEEDKQFCVFCGYDIERPEDRPSKEGASAKQFPPAEFNAPMYPQPALYQPYSGRVKIPIYWKDGYKIMVGGSLLGSGALLSITFLLLILGEPDAWLSVGVIIVLLGVLPMYIGYLLMKDFMIFSDMVKMIVLFAITAFAIFIIGLFAFVFIVYFILGLPYG